MRRTWCAAAVAAVVGGTACGVGGATAPPVVRIEGAAAVSADPGSPLQLAGTGTDPDGGPVELTWDMGDGTTVAGTGSVEHRYAESGTYRIVLSGRAADGALATPAEVLVEVGDAGAGATEAVGGNSALRFSGTGRGDVDRVKILVDDPDGRRTFAADIGATDTTWEVWLRARPGDNASGPPECGAADAWIHGNVVLDRDRYNQGRKFGMSVADGRIVFGLTGDDGTAVSLCSTSRVDDDRWHHVAVTRTVATGAVVLFVDGVPEAEVAGPPGDVSYPDRSVPEAECGGLPCTGSDPYLVIGAEKHDAGPEYPSFRGLVDELRLSTTVRYTGAFTPPRGRFTPDPGTAALYHFDEGGGTVVIDSAGTADRSDGLLRVGGSPAGPEWVPSDAPTG
jgi:PKD repeat protein